MAPPSIRTYLLINLLLSVTLITSLAIIGNLFLAHQDIQSQLDNQLQQTVSRIQAFFSDDPSRRNLKVVQEFLTAKLKTSPPLQQTSTSEPENIQFQLWDRDGKLILHSLNSPKVPFSNGKPGLTTNWLNNHAWRVYTDYNPANQITVMAAERMNNRQKLENRLTQDSILIMLITYPFLGLLIWIIVGRGLDTLKRVSEEVKHRAPTNLIPVNLADVPSEISPLVNELNQLFSRLTDAFDREKRFTADAAHELKTPLAALSAHAQVALRADTQTARNEALLKVLAGVNRSSHVVQQLLTLSRMDPNSAAAIHNMTPVDLTKQASETIAQLAPEAIAKNIDLELVNPDQPALIKGNPTAIGILLRNLVDNAIRYTQQDGEIKIKIDTHKRFPVSTTLSSHEKPGTPKKSPSPMPKEPPKAPPARDKEPDTQQQAIQLDPQTDYVVLRVIDNGPGIPEELRQRVFERFFRVIGNQATGSGLGLGIVSQIAKLHQAQVELKTSPSGQGLTVVVYFKQDLTP